MELLTGLINGNEISLMGKTYEVVKVTKYHLALKDREGDHGRGTSFAVHSDRSANGFVLSSGSLFCPFRVLGNQVIELPIKDTPVFDRMNGRGYASVMY